MIKSYANFSLSLIKQHFQSKLAHCWLKWSNNVKISFISIKNILIWSKNYLKLTNLDVNRHFLCGPSLYGLILCITSIDYNHNNKNRQSFNPSLDHSGFLRIWVKPSSSLFSFFFFITLLQFWFLYTYAFSFTRKLLSQCVCMCYIKHVLG